VGGSIRLHCSSPQLEICLHGQFYEITLIAMRSKVISPPQTSDAALLYLDLMKECLTDSLHIERGFDDKRPVHIRKTKKMKKFFINQLIRILQSRKLRLYHIHNENLSTEGMRAERKEGRDWPKYAETMIGIQRLNNIQECVERVLKENITGDLLEAGVWRGGATIFMRAILKANGVTNRKVWVADSFEGLPPPDPEFPADAGDIHHLYDELRVSLEQVQENFRRYGLLDEQVHFLKGWFKDTLSTAPIDKLAVLRTDGDMYSSTMDVLTALYDKVSVGGFVIIDDYNLQGCHKAVEEFRVQRGIDDRIISIDKMGVFWKKSKE